MRATLGMNAARWKAWHESQPTIAVGDRITVRQPADRHHEMRERTCEVVAIDRAGTIKVRSVIER